MSQGTLYVVATPIGNLGDITLRALEILKSVDTILCEDTRVTAKLLAYYNIQKPLKSYHQHSEGKILREIEELLDIGKNLALVTDAGTPGISDPGNELISHIIYPASPAGGHVSHIIPIPGVSAVTTALSISGFPTDKFIFMGFPPHKKGRKTFFQEVTDAKYTVAFYESSHRIKKCLTEFASVIDKKRQICICRELTKKFETIYRGAIEEITKMDIPEKGEFVVVVGPIK